jgi:inhibitor of cysteine peptidase
MGLLFGLAATACGGSPAAEPTPQPMVVNILVTEEFDGRVIDATTGQTITVSLKSNPSTGYTWEVVALDENVLQALGEPEFTPDSQLVGAPGRQSLQFKVVGAGETDLKLVYHRPFEKDKVPESTFSVKVSAKGRS